MVFNKYPSLINAYRFDSLHRGAHIEVPPVDLNRTGRPLQALSTQSDTEWMVLPIIPFPTL